MRTAIAVVAAGAGAFAVAACSGAQKICVEHGVRCENLPRAKVYDVDWVERTPRGVAVFRVDRIEVDRNGWKLAASITNGSPRTFRFPRGGPSSPRSFGLGVFTTPLPRRIESPGQYLLAPDRVVPPFPKRLRPGETWRGTMSGSEPPRSRRWLRGVFGVFFWDGKPPSGLGPFFAWQTEHTVQAPPPLGPQAD